MSEITFDNTWQSRFDEANELGAADFGTLWLDATSQAVSMFRDAGLGDEIERDFRLRAALSRSLYRVLCAAARHPNNIARARSRMDTRAEERQRGLS